MDYERRKKSPRASIDSRAIGVIEMNRFSRLTLLVLVLAVPSILEAKDTFHDLQVDKALNSIATRDKLLDVPIFMVGQPHETVVEELGVYKSNR